MSNDSQFRTKRQTSRILITGGAGFIGSRLARRLVEDGHQVRVLDNLLPQVHGPNPEISLSGCERIWGDVRDSRLVSKAMRRVEIVYHLAAETGVGQSQYEISRYVSTNTEGTAVVLEAAANYGVQQVVIASSRAVYGEGAWHCRGCERSFNPSARRASDMDRGAWEVHCPACGDEATALRMSETVAANPSSVYGLTKLHQEQLAEAVGRTHDLSTTILRFFNVYGPGQSMRNPYVGVLGTFLRKALAGMPVEIYEDGRMSRDFVFVDDIVEVLSSCLENVRLRNRVLNVGSGRVLSLESVARELFRALELPVRLEVLGRYRLGDVRHAVADVSALREAWGRLPSTAFDDGLKRFVDWARDTAFETSDANAVEELVAQNILRQGRA